MDSYFFPDPSSAVLDAARGLASTWPQTLAVHESPLYLTATSPASERTVAIVSGGGAGHEPLHAGFVGRGGLDAAVPGEIFTSPHNRAIYEASRAVAKPGGVLHVVKNYTGDVINFRVAAERLAAEGITSAVVLVDDDLATGSDDTETGRRGTAATVAVEKILGAAADRGASLDELAELGAAVVAGARSLAVASRAQTSPGTGDPAFALGEGELEYGVGIHGERAVETITAPSTHELLERMVGELLDAVAPGEDGLLLIVNGLGSVTELELHAVRAAVGDLLAARDVTLSAALVGTYTAALDMRGLSLTLVGLQAGWLDLWLAPSAVPGWPAVQRCAPATAGAGRRAASEPSEQSESSGSSGSSGTEGSERGAAILARYAEDVDAAHDDLTRLDQLSGDGDFGDNLTGGLRRARELPGADLGAAADAFFDGVGGTSGPLFGLVLQALATSDTQAGPAGLADALAEALESVQRVGGAQVGDRTLVDALAPAAGAARDAEQRGGVAVAAARAAVDGASGTSSLRARRGRASYVGERALGSPDPGAVGIALLLVAIAAVDDPGGAGDLPSPASLAASAAQTGRLDP